MKSGINNVAVQGLIPTSAAGLPFVIVDDDDFNSDDATKDGDDGEDIEALLTTFSLMQDSDNPATNVFAPAYIRPIYDGGGSTSNNSGSIPFLLNVASGSVESQMTLGHDSEAAESDDFWGVNVQVAYHIKAARMRMKVPMGRVPPAERR